MSLLGGVLGVLLAKFFFIPLLVAAGERPRSRSGWSTSGSRVPTLAAGVRRLGRRRDPRRVRSRRSGRPRLKIVGRAAAGGLTWPFLSSTTSATSSCGKVSTGMTRLRHQASSSRSSSASWRLVQGVTRTLSVNRLDRGTSSRIRVGSQAEMQSVITRDQADQIQAAAGHRARRATGRPTFRRSSSRLISLPREDGKTARNVQVRGMDADRRRDAAGRQDRGRADVPGRHQRGDRLDATSRSVREHEARADRSSHGSFRWVIVGLLRRRRAAPTSRRSGPTRHGPAAADSSGSVFSSVFVRTADAARREPLHRDGQGDQRLKLEGKTERKYYDEQMITGDPIKALALHRRSSSPRSAPPSAR